MEAHEQELVEYTLEKFEQLRDRSHETGLKQVKLIGSTSSKKRVGVFTFAVTGIHSFDISDYLAEHNICIRAGQHCAEPFMEYVGQLHTCRMSLYLYNTHEDIDSFFEILEKAIHELA